MPSLRPYRVLSDRLQSPIRRYADVLAHRQLAAAINYTPLHPSLQSKSHVEKAMHVVNRRHRLAQMASRASIEFYVGLALRARGQARGTKEEAFVIRTFRNGLAVFVSSYVAPPCLPYLTEMFRLGLEGLITFTKDTHAFDPGGGEAMIGVFDKIVVEVSIEKDRNTQRGKVKMIMVEPVSSEGL